MMIQDLFSDKNHIGRNMKKEEIHVFALKWFEKLNDENSTFYELADNPRFGADCLSLGFVMDCGIDFSTSYGDALNDPKKLKEIINEVNSISLLGSALISKWRYFNHWEYSIEEIKEPENVEWFKIILSRLAELTE